MTDGTKYHNTSNICYENHKNYTIQKVKATDNGSDSVPTKL